MDLMRKPLAGAAVVLVTQYARSAKADEGALPMSGLRGTRALNSERDHLRTNGKSVWCWLFCKLLKVLCPGPLTGYSNSTYGQGLSKE